MKNVTKLILVFILINCCKYAITAELATPDKVVYDVVFRESLAGKYEKSKTGKSSFAFYYAYADRGRGPEFNEEITLNNKGFITSLSIDGVNYRKNAMTERFNTAGKKATWLNTMGQNDGDFNGDALYFRYDGTPAIYEILAKLLMSAEDKKVQLYPKGEVQLINITPVTLSNDKTVNLLMLKGLGITPSYLWVTGDELIAKIDGNLHIVRQDFKSHRKEMQGIQSNIEDHYLINESNKLTHKIDEIVIRNVNVFTAEGPLLHGQDVYVVGDNIERIAPHSKNKVNSNVQVIDGTGKTLLPGMFDMHTHNTKFRGMLHVAGGITSVRDLANNKQVKLLSEQFNSNEIIGPRIVTFAGIIDGPGEFANQRNVVNNLDEALAEIQDYKDLGYQQIKIYSSIKPEWVTSLTKKAHDLGMRVSGHIPAFMTATESINQGYDEIQHINMVFLNFLSDSIDTRTPLRHTMPANHGIDLDLNSKIYLDFIELLKEKNIRIDPTVAIFENMYIATEGEASPTYAQITDRLPLLSQRGHYIGGLPKSGEKVARYEGSFNKMLDVVYDLYKKGIEIVPGTDGLPGFLYHRELELYVKAGIPEAEVLKIATIKSAEMTGVAQDYGSIEVGKKADLILVDGNPLEDISDIRNVEITLKGGKLFYTKELYNAMGIKHFK